MAKCTAPVRGHSSAAAAAACPACRYRSRGYGYGGYSPSYNSFGSGGSSSNGGAAYQVLAQDRVGREPGLLSPTRLPRSCH